MNEQNCVICAMSCMQEKLEEGGVTGKGMCNTGRKSERAEEIERTKKITFDRALKDGSGGHL